MYIYPIQSNAAQNKNTTSFGRLIKDKSALKIIKQMSKEDVAELNRIKKRLSKSKSWDLKISDSGLNNFAFKFEFIHKKNKHEIIDNSIYPYKIQDNKLKIYTIMLGKEQESESANLVETLVFKSVKRATELYSKYKKSVEEATKKHWLLTPIENLKNRELQLKMLEEGFQYQEKGNVVNTEYKTKNTVGNFY